MSAFSSRAVAAALSAALGERPRGALVDAAAAAQTGPRDHAALFQIYRGRRQPDLEVLAERIEPPAGTTSCSRPRVRHDPSDRHPGRFAHRLRRLGLLPLGPRLRTRARVS